MSRTSLLVIVLLSACADDPVSYSAPVSINLKAESDKVENNASLSDDKGITTETGNPYGAFVADARRTLGQDPARVEIDRLTLLLGAKSEGVTSLDQIYAGDVDVLFLVDTSNNTYPAGRVTNPTGTGPVNVGVSFQSNAVADQDWSKFLGGGFKVVIRGTAAAEFSTKGAKADLQLTFTFAAYE
jgi:hypothetical protein